MRSRLTSRSLGGALAVVCLALLTILGGRYQRPREPVPSQADTAWRRTADKAQQERTLFHELTVQLADVPAAPVPPALVGGARARHDALVRRLATVSADRVRVAAHIVWAADHPEQPCGTSDLDPMAETCRSLRTRLVLEPQSATYTRTALARLTQATGTRLQTVERVLITEEQRLRDEVASLPVALPNPRDVHAAAHLGARRRALAERRDAVWLRLPPVAFGDPTTVVEVDR